MKKQRGELMQNGRPIQASDAQPGCLYMSRTGRQIIVKGKEKDRILVQAVSTGNIIPLAADYPLQPIL
ncbi:MAG: hypothetical protein HY709_04905 [Candidatus Latescibacteria bacterium]|nr:hypothetical protein [Candidatus Latescibacterota bacterium]